MLGECSIQSKQDKEKTIAMFFETYNVPAFYTCVRESLSLYASGRETGIVMDCGFESTNIVPVFEGYTITNAISKISIGGKTITSYLNTLLEQRGYKLTTPSGKESVRKIKEKLCKISENYESDLIKAENNDESNQKNVRAPEILFKPSLIEHKSTGIHNELFSSIQELDIDMRVNMYSNIVLAGGSTLFKGIVERLSDEIQKRVSKEEKVRIVAPEERKYSTWIGGSIKSSLSTFGNWWVVKDEYDDVGESIVHRKCYQ